MNEDPTTHKVALNEINSLFGEVNPDERNSSSSGSPTPIEKKPFGVAKMNLAELEKRVDQAGYPAQRDEIMMEWVNAKLEEKVEPKSFVRGLISIMEKHEFYAEREIIIKIIPFAIEHCRDKLFDLLCAAHKTVCKPLVEAVEIAPLECQGKKIKSLHNTSPNHRT